jgi:hypothetical protein
MSALKKGGPRFTRENGYLVNVDLIESSAQLVEYVDHIWENIWAPRDPCLEQESPWFRGVNGAAFKLVPTIYRQSIWKYNSVDAEDIWGEFSRRSSPFLEQGRFYSPGEFYHIMQHYGLPTRLLDWTEGLLFGLFFALRGVRPLGSTSTPCVWMLNPWWLNKKSTQKRELYYSHFIGNDADNVQIISPYLSDANLPPDPVAVLPPHIDRRIVAQKSVFTIHGSRKDGIGDLCRKHKNAQLAQLRLDGGKIDTFLDQLLTAGITETSVFPDLEGLSREIRMQYDMF